MIYYIGTFIFILVIFMIYVAIEVYAEHKQSNKTHHVNDRCNDMYLLEYYDAIMHTDLNSSLAKR